MRAGEIVYVADPDFALPAGTSIEDFDGFIWTGSDLTVYHQLTIRVLPGRSISHGH